MLRLRMDERQGRYNAAGDSLRVERALSSPTTSCSWGVPLFLEGKWVTHVS